jgi:hypothetical protein
MPPPLVLFIDELDVVRSLPFSTDEFFAAIRECYNRRTEEPELNRVTFCLLGVASPSDLIRNTRLTPFNIGRRVELNDFTPPEAAVLTEGLQPNTDVRTKETKNARAMLDRILYWTNGHPYLTQRLCQVLSQHCATQAQGPEATKTTGDPFEIVDVVCSEIFFSPRAREQDDKRGCCSFISGSIRDVG